MFELVLLLVIVGIVAFLLRPKQLAHVAPLIIQGTHCHLTLDPSLGAEQSLFEEVTLRCSTLNQHIENMPTQYFLCRCAKGSENGGKDYLCAASLYHKKFYFQAIQPTAVNLSRDKLLLQISVFAQQVMVDLPLGDVCDETLKNTLWTALQAVVQQRSRLIEKLV